MLFSMYYFSVLAELFNNARDGVFRQPVISLPVLITFASLKVRDNVIFALESLMKEESCGLLLTG